MNLLERISDTWVRRRDKVEEAASGLTVQLRAMATGFHAGSGALPSLDEAAESAAARIGDGFDPVHGGFGHAPKFPPDQALAFLLHHHRRTGEDSHREIVDRTLTAMARGGMYDQVGGGFCRYSVDERWLVPHFEKMLYNQALLTPVYAEAWKKSQNNFYRRTVCDTLDFVRRELTNPEGGACSSLDADSEGVEGKFYVWKQDQVQAVLGKEDATLFCKVYGIGEPGNFEGSSIPNLLDRNQDQPDPLDEALDAVLRPMRMRLLEAREKRIRPGTDDKVLTAWNGLMITGYVAGHEAFGREQDLEAAILCADFILGNLQTEGRLLASWREGMATHTGYLDDYAFLARGLLDLYEACRKERYLQEAGRLGAILLERFEDQDRGGWYFIADDHPPLLVRNRSGLDGTLPSGAGVTTETLVRLAARLNENRFREAAIRALDSYQGELRQAPNGCSSLLSAMSLLETGVPPLEVCKGEECDL